MRRLSRAADGSRLWFGVAAAIAFFGGADGRRAARSGLVSLGIASAFANLVAKPLTTRRRPEREELEVLARRHVPMPASSSFPSGHAASAQAFATGVGQVQPALSVPLRALATLVGYSRVHTGVHFPADVLAGAFIGVSAAELANRLLDRR
jgi:undecaprenyl-diphosphatase